MSAQAEDPVMAAAARPLRIKCLTLTDFRAFPGTGHFDLDSKNLLVYGENGAGKSSVFHALKEFFSLKPSRPLLTYKNVFSDKPDDECAVTVEFDDAEPAATWTSNKHPCERGPRRPTTSYHEYYFGQTDMRVRLAALRAGHLDYRALLDTNYKHGAHAVNLFEIAVDHLLRDFPVAVAGGSVSTLGELWAGLGAHETYRPGTSKKDKAARERIDDACVEFNKALRSATSALLPVANELMDLLHWEDVRLVDLRSPGLTYKTAHLKRDRMVQGRELTPELTYRGHSLTHPQLFLNEARLSALGLALYLAGRLACTPTAEATVLKLLVLDDVLIGLDNSNRTPVLDVLMHKFAGWQVVLLTHDRNWFDLARNHLPHEDWRCYEVYEGDRQAQAPMPIVYPTDSRPALGLLSKARELLETPYVEAAANYTRQAFELGARKACEVKGIKMPYHMEPKHYKAKDFLTAMKAWPAKDPINTHEWAAAMRRLEASTTVVLNPYSHALAPNIPKREVETAIDAVNGFLDLVARRRQ